MSQTKKTIEVNGKRIVLIGTAHVSKESVEEVEREIREEKPDCVAIELDQQRFESLNDSEGYKNVDVVKILRSGKGFLMLANLVLASFQKRMGDNAGVKPGDEMRAGINVAKELGIPSVMVDRPIQTTLRRAWAKTSFWGKSKLLAALLASAFDTEEVSTQEVENLKNSSEMDSMMGELSSAMPAVKEVLIDERDFYLAAHIWKSVTKSDEGDNDSRKSVLAVLGAGHLPGVERNLMRLSGGEVKPDTKEISELPKKSAAGKFAKWLIPLLIVALIVSGFFIGGKELAVDSLIKWFVCNGLLAGLGAIIALGHPLAVLVSIVGAPFTSLCPFIGVGILSGIVQAVLKKPKVRDLESVQDDVSSVKGFYKNRLLRVLLVFILSSLGSSIGTFVAGSSLVVGLTQSISAMLN